jgi:hypothetical protein
VIGEIDCREGVLRAYEKDLYSSVDDGILRTCEIFRATLKNLIASRPSLKVPPRAPFSKNLAHYSIQIYIHPVLPVLDITRSIVLRFNDVFRQVINEIPGI